MLWLENRPNIFDMDTLEYTSHYMKTLVLGSPRGTNITLGTFYFFKYWSFISKIITIFWCYLQFAKFFMYVNSSVSKQPARKQNKPFCRWRTQDSERLRHLLEAPNSRAWNPSGWAKSKPRAVSTTHPCQHRWWNQRPCSSQQQRSWLAGYWPWLLHTYCWLITTFYLFYLIITPYG